MEEYENISLLVAGIALVAGLLLILAPSLLIKAGEYFNRVYNVESVVYSKHIPFGLLYIVAGALLLYILW